MSLLDVLVISCNQQKYQEVFIENKGKLLVSICLNFIKTSEVEADLIVEDATEFVNLAIDSCDKQKSETVKTHACKLFENLCDNIDGSTTFGAIFCCNAINKVYGKPISEEAFWGMETDPFLANNEPEFIVESCLVALTVMSYILPERKDLTLLFTDCMQVNINEMLERKSILPDFTHLQVAKAVIVRVRLSLMIGYYGDLLFENQLDSFKKTTSFLFESVGIVEGPERVVGLQSIDTLKTITVDSDVAKRYLAFLPEIVQWITQLIATSSIPQFFEFVLEFGKFYCRVMNEQILIVFDAVVNRVLHE